MLKLLMKLYKKNYSKRGRIAVMRRHTDFIADVLSNVCFGDLVCVQDLALRMTLDNICQVAFGVEMGCCSPLLPNVALVTNFDGAQVMAIQRSVDPFWRVKRALNMGRERRMREAIHYVNSFAASVIAKRRSDILAAHNAGKEFVSPHLLLQNIFLS